MVLVTQRPSFSTAEAARLAAKHYRLSGDIEELPSERDQNFRLELATGERFVLKIAHPDEAPEVLDFQNAALKHLAEHHDPELYPRLIPARSGEEVLAIDKEATYHVRLLTYLPGRPWARLNAHPNGLLRQVGRILGEMDDALQTFTHPAMHRYLQWDARRAAQVIRANLSFISDPGRAGLVEQVVAQFEAHAGTTLGALRTSIIHNDVNDYNLLVQDGEVSGIIDFGDMLHSFTVCELANASAYLMLGKDDPLDVAVQVLRGYQRAYPLTQAEQDVLYDFILLRLGLSVCLSAKQQHQDPLNRYLAISEAPAWALLEHLSRRESTSARERLRSSMVNARTTTLAAKARSKAEILAARRRHLGKNLSVSYQESLKMVRGEGQYLYDETGRAYLDCVNNVCHVGHCHPRVVAAGQRQMAVLNTNTRYLHDHIVEYAERLTATLPEPLSVCFFVNSGSEANDLALRLARAHSKQRDMIVVDHAYHGHLTSLIEISPYKFDGKGGEGAPAHTHKVIMPDGYRGPYKYRDLDAGDKYAAEVRQVIEGLERRGRGVAGFISESLMGCGGQIVLPDGYLQAAFGYSHEGGGVCISDEVQVGFGRVGTHMWGFETQGVVPDIVTMGKPIGNGHPLAAVVTTPEIAASFDSGMEYFNTFGGNPVSCAIGLAVLEVIQGEGLQQNALEVGQYFKAALEHLRAEHTLIGDVRGLGLFIGVELVRDRDTLEPATTEATFIINQMKERGILLSTDGPYDNVLKIKPPLLFTRKNADDVVTNLDDVLSVLGV